jgi:hypothetical protein
MAENNKGRTNKQPSFFPRSNSWKMGDAWNLALVSKAERPMKERDRVWASELGKANIEIFLKMRGVEPTNPPNARSKRKFEAGNMFEWVVGLVLKRAGILKENQKWVGYNYPGLVQVTGKIDYIAGGIPDYEHYKEHLAALELPEFFMAASQAIVENFAEKYPEGLADLFLEIKSCSSFMMDAMERTGNASKNHRLQLFHYLKAENFPRGNVVYICRDDLRMLEIPVENNAETEKEYRKAVEEISAFYQAHKDTPIEKFLIKPANDDELKWTWIPLEGLPPLEKNLVWDEDLKKFARNWGVEYSAYLTMLYGYETQLQFEEEVMPIVSRWNRVLGRMKTAYSRVEWLKSYQKSEIDVVIEKTPKTAESKAVKRQYIISTEGDQVYLPDDISKGYEMTAKNVDVIKEMQQSGFDPMALAPQYAGTAEEEEAVVT